MSHSSSHHRHPHPSSAYANHGPPSYAPGHGYHHSSSRHPANGPSQGITMGGHHSDAVGPPPVQVVGNGHSHGPSPVTNEAVRRGKEKMEQLLTNLAAANENTWMLIGAVAEQMNDQDRALAAFENALRHNPTSILGLNAVASIARSRDNFDKAIEYFQRILSIKQDNGEVWGSMGHCLLMKDDLPKAYTAYQQALYHLPNPKEPKLWYGIGILYDRYGSFEHAEEAFSSVLKMDPNFEKANEIYFRLGIIYKHQRKYQASLECFRYILNNPPRPLTSWDIWFQLGHVYEQERDYELARDAYMRVLQHQPDHAKVLQQLGWLHHQPGAPFADQDKAISYLTKSLETDGNDAQSWYLLGRAFMAGQRYNKAYEAYQQAVYRDGRNPTFWCSIGVLYYQINQYRDALDAYSRAIRLNPYISEVWYNLGSLYESCNNQITDAIDAYTRATDLDPGNAVIKQRLHLLQNAGVTNAPLPPAPGPVDVHPSQYNSNTQGSYPPGTPASPRMLPGQMPPVDGAQRDLPPPPLGGDPPRGHSPGPFRGGAAPPPLQMVDESRGAMSRHAPLAPMDTGTEAREAYRNGTQRFDAAVDRQHPPSPGSPRRREAYPGYPPYANPNHRDRERETWERERAARNGPAPRVPERTPHPSQDPRRAEYGYGWQESRAQHPPTHDPRREEERRREEQRRYEAGMKGREGTPNANGNGHSLRALSVSHSDGPRAPSPALSTASRKRGNPSPEMAIKRSKDKKPVSAKKNSEDGPEKSGISLKLTLPRPAPNKDEEEVEGGSPAKSSGSPTAPNRSVDEDYDEGAADALMFLHGDRSSAPANGEEPSTGTKRADPPSPNSPQTTKKSRADSEKSPKQSPVRSASRTTVIEVLNAERIQSPAVVTPTVGTQPGEVKEEKAVEQEQEMELSKAEGEVEEQMEVERVQGDEAPVTVEPTAAAAVEEEPGDVTMAEPDAQGEVEVPGISI